MTIRQWLMAACKEDESLNRFDLEVLISERIDMSRASLLAHLDDALEENMLLQLDADKQAMINGEPLQYILGRAYFMDATFKVNENVLIPRFDTEYLVQAVLERVGETVKDVLDICTGSGIIAISFARARKNWRVCGSDISEGALAVAKENDKTLCGRVEWRLGDLLNPWIDSKFDVIVSNPPYIAQEEYDALSVQVHQEPKLALIAEHEGLAYYERLCSEAPHFLKENGLLAVEIGWQQGKAVSELFCDNGFCDISCLPDGQGHDRVVLGYYRK